MTQKISDCKSNAFKLSEQVKNLLQQKGYSSNFNYPDFKHFKRQAKKAFNKAQAIAEMFIDDNRQNSDFNGYIF